METAPIISPFLSLMGEHVYPLYLNSPVFKWRIIFSPFTVSPFKALNTGMFSGKSLLPSVSDIFNSSTISSTFLPALFSPAAPLALEFSKIIFPFPSEIHISDSILFIIAFNISYFSKKLSTLSVFKFFLVSITIPGT